MWSIFMFIINMQMHTSISNSQENTTNTFHLLISYTPKHKSSIYKLKLYVEMKMCTYDYHTEYFEILLETNQMDEILKFYVLIFENVMQTEDNLQTKVGFLLDDFNNFVKNKTVETKRRITNTIRKKYIKTNTHNIFKSLCEIFVDIFIDSINEQKAKDIFKNFHKEVIAQYDISFTSYNDKKIYDDNEKIYDDNEKIYDDNEKMYKDNKISYKCEIKQEKIFCSNPESRQSIIISNNINNLHNLAPFVNKAFEKHDNLYISSNFNSVVFQRLFDCLINDQFQLISTEYNKIENIILNESKIIVLDIMKLPNNEIAHKNPIMTSEKKIKLSVVDYDADFDAIRNLISKFEIPTEQIQNLSSLIRDVLKLITFITFYFIIEQVIIVGYDRRNWVLEIEKCCSVNFKQLAQTISNQNILIGDFHKNLMTFNGNVYREKINKDFETDIKMLRNKSFDVQIQGMTLYIIQNFHLTF